jgi:hypothetical protein
LRSSIKIVLKASITVYEKAVHFAFNLIIKNENEVRLAGIHSQLITEVLEIEDQQAEVYLELLLRLIFYFSKYRATTTELDICL